MTQYENAPATALAGRGQSWFKSGLLFRFGAIFGQWHRRYSVRKQVVVMLDMNDAQLADIGLKRADIHEALSRSGRDDLGIALTRARRDPLRGVRRP